MNIFDSFLSSSTTDIKINDLYKYQEILSQTFEKFNRVIRDFQDIDPDKAAYYIKLALSPNPIKIAESTNKEFTNSSSNEAIKVLQPVNGFNTYKSILDEIADYKNSIPSIETLPFKGRETIASYSLDDSSLWDIKLKKSTYSDVKIPENPLSKDGSWFPVTNVNLSYSKISNKEFLMPNNLKLTIPSFRSEVPSITLSCFDNQDSIIRKYFIDYMNAMFDEERRVLPYKDSCSELTLYIYTVDKKIKFKKIYYVIPQYDFSIIGTNDSKVTEFTIPFNIIGESSDIGDYELTAPYKPKK
jgi:hypothetical protein